MNKKTPKFNLVNYKHPDKFGEWLGYKLVTLDRKNLSAKIILLIREDHLSPAGRVHGGVVSALFDYASGAAVFSTLSKNDFCSTVELKVNYLQPVVLGDLLLVNTKVVFRGKRLCVVHGFMYKKDKKKPVAMVTATFNIISTNKLP